MTQEIATQEYLATALKKFTVTDVAIANMRDKYMPLKVSGADDRAGYLAVKEARLTVKSQRVIIEKARKELTADALSFQKAVNAEATRIKDALTPIETHLAEQEEFYEAEKERIKREKENAELELLSLRTSILIELGFEYYDNEYQFYWNSLHSGIKLFIKVTPLQLKTMSYEEFDFFHKDALRSEEHTSELQS